MEQNSGLNATMDVFCGGVISENVRPSLQTGSSLHQQSFLFHPPPICHLSDNKLILWYRWRELTFFFFFIICLPSLSSGFCHILKIKPACIFFLLYLKPARIWDQIKMLAAALHCNLSVFALFLCLLQHTIVRRLPGNAWKRCYSSQSVAFSDGYKNRCGYKVDVLMDYLICFEKDLKFWYISRTSNMLFKSVYWPCLL